MGWFSFWSLFRATRTRHHHHLEETEKALWCQMAQFKTLTIGFFSIPQQEANSSHDARPTVQDENQTQSHEFWTQTEKLSVFLSSHPPNRFAIQWQRHQEAHEWLTTLFRFVNGLWSLTWPKDWIVFCIYNLCAKAGCVSQTEPSSAAGLLRVRSSPYNQSYLFKVISAVSKNSFCIGRVSRSYN